MAAVILAGCGRRGAPGPVASGTDSAVVRSGASTARVSLRVVGLRDIAGEIAEIHTGRLFTAADTASTSQPTAIVSVAVREAFGGGDLTGRTINVNGRDVVVIGTARLRVPDPNALVIWLLSR